LQHTDGAACPPPEELDISMNEAPSYVIAALSRSRPGLVAVAIAAIVGIASMGAVFARIVDPAPRSSAPAVILPSQERDCSMAEFECAWDPAFEREPTLQPPLS